MKYETEHYIVKTVFLFIRFFFPHLLVRCLRLSLYYSENVVGRKHTLKKHDLPTKLMADHECFKGVPTS